MVVADFFTDAIYMEREYGASIAMKNDGRMKTLQMTIETKE